MRKMRKLRMGCVSAQYMRKILSQCAIYAQDLHKIVLLSQMCNICARLYLFPNAQYMRKIVLLSPMRNICARFAQDCTYFPNVQLYVQDLRKIVLLSPMCNICARFVQDCTYFPNVQYMCKICARLYLTSNLKC